MNKPILASIRVALLFFRRSRLVQVCVLLFFCYVGLMIIPSFFMGDLDSKYEGIVMAMSMVGGILPYAMGPLALIHVATTLRSHTGRMVFTNAQSPGGWLFAGIVAVVMIGILWQGLASALSMALMYFNDVPVTSGMNILTAVSLLGGLLAASYMTFLATVTHPAFATFLFFVLSPSAIRWFLVMLGDEVQAADPGVWGVVYPLLQGVYLLLPDWDDSAGRFDKMSYSMRAVDSDVADLSSFAIYAIGYSALLIILSALMIHRRRPL